MIQTEATLYGPAPLERDGAGRIVLRLSPSRVEAYLQCPARWGFVNLEGWREPDTEATLLGTAVHAVHERYYLDGTPPDVTTRAGYIAQAMRVALPTCDGSQTPELELCYEAEPGLLLGGRLDLAYLGRELAHVRDYKTTASMRYAKLERDALFGHSQAPLYSLMLMGAFDLPRAECGWVYADTRSSLGPPERWTPPAVEVSNHVITRDEATERVHLRMVPPARAMVQARDEGVRAVDLPKNLTACHSYGRPCPHMARCQPEKAKQVMLSFLQAVEAAANPQQTPAVESKASLFGSVDAPVAQASSQIQEAASSASAPGEPPAEQRPHVVPAAINPPEGASPINTETAAKGRKKKADAGDGPRLTESEIAAIADAVVQRLGLRLVSTLGSGQ